MNRPAQAGYALHELSSADRMRVLEALFPAVAPHVERGWRLYDRLPYQAGYTRRPFRAPTGGAETLAARSSWLSQLVRVLGPYEQPIRWVAEWAPYLADYYGSTLGVLLAGAIDSAGSEGQAVYETLVASARGEHAVGAMGRHVVSGLLCASRSDGWEFVERLLLAAERQEGLRQSILENIDEALPEAFRRFLRLILAHDLQRFSSTIRAFDVWLGMGLEAESAGVVRACLGQLQTFLESPEETHRALHSPDPRTAYLALWTLAFENAPAAVPYAASLLTSPAKDIRVAAARLLGQVWLRDSRLALRPALDDPELEVAVTAFVAIAPHVGGTYTGSEPYDLFEPMERLLARCPAGGVSFKIEWANMEAGAGPQLIAKSLCGALGERPVEALLPYLNRMEVGGRELAVKIFAEQKDSSPAAREALIGMVGDAGTLVRNAASEALSTAKLSPDEAPLLERLLTRKSEDLRRGLLTLLLNQPDSAAVASADRLLAAKELPQRLAGLELLRELQTANRAATQCKAAAAAYRARRGTLSSAEEDVLTGLLDDGPEEVVTLDDALGLMDPARKTAPRIPHPVPGVTLESRAAERLRQSLDDLVHQHRETPIPLKHWDESEHEELLGNLRWGFNRPDPEADSETDAARLPLRDIWLNWWQNRGPELRDPDGLELLRALANAFRDRGDQQPVRPLRYDQIVNLVLQWMLRLAPPEPVQKPARGGLLSGLKSVLGGKDYQPASTVDFLLDAAETQLSGVSAEELRKKPEHSWHGGWRGESRWSSWIELCDTHFGFHSSKWTPQQLARHWALLRWMDEPGVGSTRHRPALDQALAAYSAGVATRDDLMDLFLGPRDLSDVYNIRFDSIRQHSGRKSTPLVTRYPVVAELVAECRRRLIEVELKRGDLPTPASRAATELRSAGGLATLIRLVHALGKGNLVRGYVGYDMSRSSVLSHLIRVTFPGEGETPEVFTEAARGSGVPEKRWIEIAFYAPQWANHIERLLDWPHFADAVWWIHAHTKDSQWTVDQEIRETWASQVAEGTPLTAAELVDGAVDVEWFRRVYAQTGPERWKLLDAAAKYTSGGGGHKRAQLFADAMLGRVTEASLRTAIAQKRTQDALRALALLPLAPGEEGAPQALERYRIIQEWVRESRQFGSQRQASEKLAAQIALDNLARTAGYPDPVRLQWAMEASEIADLAQGPVSAVSGDVSVTLSLNEWGEPEIGITRGGKPLKSVPATLKKDADIAALQERKRQVERQASRMRLSLEAAMCRGDRFPAHELRELLGHPVLAPMLRNLVFRAESGTAGYPVDGGRALEGPNSATVPLDEAGELRIAHPHDLFHTGGWSDWQRDCFRRERIQPFRQVFRELYLLTEAEQSDGAVSRRYDGHQVNSRQARAILGKRGWISNPNEGDIRRTFHHEGLTAWVNLDQGYTTPAEVEGLTVSGVGFVRRGEWKPVPLAKIPPRVFSEVMRDLDLVVSVAHQGGVDPEATASTVEMRAALLRETCLLLKLDNVRAEGSHVLIQGKLGSYSIHLGSAVVHRQPGGHLCIVPVHSQHRGRIFLPFADNDPKTAEVLSKALLLARDDQIKDPTILEQIFAAAR